MIPHDLALALVRYEAIYSTFKPKMNITQFIVMGAIENGKTHTQANVSGKTGLQQVIVRNIIHKLHAKKFLRRTQKTGFKAGRATERTELGQRAYDECEAILRRTDNEFFAGWGTPHQLECIEAIHRLAGST